MRLVQRDLVYSNKYFEFYVFDFFGQEKNRLLILHPQLVILPNNRA